MPKKHAAVDIAAVNMWVATSFNYIPGIVFADAFDHSMSVNKGRG